MMKANIFNRAPKRFFIGVVYLKSSLELDGTFVVIAHGGLMKQYPESLKPVHQLKKVLGELVIEITCNQQLKADPTMQNTAELRHPCVNISN